MSILTWIDDNERLKLLNASKYIRPSTDSNKGLWTRCDKCGVILYIKHLIENQRVCFGCAYHLQMNSPERIKNLLDKESWRPFDETVSPCDPLEFHDQKNYTDRLQAAQDKTGLQDAIQTGSGRIEGIPVALGVMDFDFMGGSMGSVVGEKITRLIEYATQEGLTLILICASGGARMQEGVFGLMQMAKISSALRIYQSCANLLYISILTSPTTGGVTASFGMLGDIIFAEPRALIAFAGRRVIEQTLCEDLPEDFQSSEYMLNHGLVDLIVPRRFLRQALSESIKFYKNAPFKKTGKIPFGVQNPINFVTEEKVRRQWFKQFDGSGLDAFSNKMLDSSFTDTPQNSFQFSKNELDRQEGNIVAVPEKANVWSSDNASPIASEPFVETDSRSKPRYRDILTSFQMIFHLFEKQLVLPCAFAGGDHLQQTKFRGSDSEGTGLANFVQKKESLLEINPETDFTTSPDSYTEKESTSKQKRQIYRDHEEDIDFLNQAIELAATESIEWRAFYVSQRISKTTAEDFFSTVRTGVGLPTNQDISSFFGENLVEPSNQDSISGNNKKKQNNTVFHNTLFYKSICRSTSR